MGAGRLPEIILERVRQRYKCLNMHSAFGRAEHNSQTLFDAKPGCGDDDRLLCVRRFGVVLPKFTLARRDHISASVGLRNHLSSGYIVHFAPKSANSVSMPLPPGLLGRFYELVAGCCWGRVTERS